jgi:membrane protein
MYVSWMAVLLGAVVAANLPTWRVDERLAHLSTGGVRLGFSLALIAALARAQRRGTACRTAQLAAELGVATSVIDEHLQQLTRAGFAAPTQAGGWVPPEPGNRDPARPLRGARPAARRPLAPIRWRPGR